MAVTIGGIELTNHSYDEPGDVRYLSVGEPRVPAETDATSEGHAADFDADDKVNRHGAGQRSLADQA